MRTISQKQEILQALSSMDSAQAEKVLNYIQGLVNGQPSGMHYQKLKRQAMKEIRQALGQTRKFNSSF